MIQMPIYTYTSYPPRELQEYASSLWNIALYAKALNQMDLYNQAKTIHDKLARDYQARTAPKKKGFWEMFKDNITFRDMDHHITISIECIEGDKVFENYVRAAKDFEPYLLRQKLQEVLELHNRKYGQ